MNRARRTSSLLFVALLLAVLCAACAPGEASKPDLPASVSPGWALKKMEASALPERLPQTTTPPHCWKADYAADAGSAALWVCGYTASGSAFDALQRMNSGPNEVKFQKGQYLVVTRWTGVSQTQITTLVSAIQRALPDK